LYAELGAQYFRSSIIYQLDSISIRGMLPSNYIAINYQLWYPRWTESQNSIYIVSQVFWIHLVYSITVLGAFRKLNSIGLLKYPYFISNLFLSIPKNGLVARKRHHQKRPAQMDPLALFMYLI